MLDVRKCSLVVVDVQGKLAGLMDDKETLFGNIEVLIKTAKALDIGIIYCQQNPAALGDTIPQLAGLLTDVEPVDKFSFSCCGEERFNARLKEIGSRQIILCGIEAHICVSQTAIDLLDTGREVYVVADAVSSRTAENKAIAVKRMAGEGAVIVSTEMAMFELLRHAKHKKFRELAILIK